MAAKKTKVVFIKRVEDRNKTTGEKEITPAGTRGEMTAAGLKKYKDCVRVIKDDEEEGARPVLAASAAPDASGGAGGGDDDDESGGDGTTGG
ncbi:hypothetical protein [Marinobacter phage PS3]|nr:hypothetical protein [Marinobacter phage PS3]